MATHWGNEGTVKIGSSAIAEIDNWSVTESVEPIDDTAMGDAWETHIATSGIKKWEGQLECHWDETDTNGQEALTIGASVALNLYPEGATTGDKYWSGTASVVSKSTNVQKNGSTIRTTFQFRGNGALTYGTAA